MESLETTINSYCSNNENEKTENEILHIIFTRALDRQYENRPTVSAWQFAQLYITNYSIAAIAPIMLQIADL